MTIHRIESTPNLGEDCLHLEQLNNRCTLHEVLCTDIKSIVIWIANHPSVRCCAMFGGFSWYLDLYLNLGVVAIGFFGSHAFGGMESRSLLPLIFVLLLVWWLLRFCSLVQRIWSVFGLVPFKHGSFLGFRSRFGVIVVFMFLNAMESPKRQRRITSFATKFRSRLVLEVWNRIHWSTRYSVEGPPFLLRQFKSCSIATHTRPIE